ncbi:MAG: hypothetical protein K0U38_00725 [Epsilonproteobacteria bacterium]|nr:hypothetical protein [Campylobacterota bacterium]
MQTLTVQVQDSFMQEFLNFVQNRQESIHIEKDYNLEHDPYFYRRQRELYRIRDEIKLGKIQMISNDDFWDDIDNFVETLVK